MLVSTVIPTFGRSTLVRVAVASAFSQTISDIEVVVVLAGPDADTERVLSAIADQRLRVLPCVGRESASAARNRGIRAANGSWIALLDDDDEWLPDKLRRQLEVAQRSRHEYPVVSCAMLARDGQSERIWPRRLPAAGESASDYVLRRKTVLGACAFLQTSTLFAKRALFLQVPFRDDLLSCQDLDWVVRAAAREDVGLEFVLGPDGSRVEPMSVWNIDPDRHHESSAHRWTSSLAWIRENRGLVGAEAYASYVLTWISREAARDKAGAGVFWRLWREAVQLGRPSALDVVVHLGHWLLPHSALQTVTSWLMRQRQRERERL